MVRVAAAQTGLRGPDHRVGADRRLRAGRAGPLAARALGRAPDLRRRERTDADPPAARHRSLRREPARLRRPPRRRLRVARRDAARHAGRLPVPRSGKPASRRSRKPEAGSRTPAAAAACSPAARDRIRTLAFGVIVDPNISQPLPFAGLSYVDFNLFGTGTQFSGFFGGSYGQLAFSAPSIARHALAARRARVRHRLVVQRSGVRAADASSTTYDIRQRPAQASVWAAAAADAALSALRLEYDWDYTKFGAGDDHRRRRS